MTTRSSTARSLARSLPLVACIVVAGCGVDEGGGASEASSGTSGASAVETSTPLEVASGIGLRNARMPLEGLVTAAQPDQAEMEALADAGFRNFISLRTVGEDGAGWEEGHASDRDYDFDRLPISGAGDLTRENVEAFAALLDEAGDEPTVLYCASSNRVGALLALEAYWLDGVEGEEALELGRAGGLAGLEGAVRERLGMGG